MSDIIDSIIGFVTNPFGIFDSSSKKGRMMSLGNAPVPLNYPIFLQTDANGNISTFDFETQNFKALKISGDITSNGNLTVTGDIKSNGKLTVSGEVTILNDTIPGRFATHFPHTPSKENWISGPTNFRQGGIKVEAGQTICIGGTCVSEQDLINLKTANFPTLTTTTLNATNTINVPIQGLKIKDTVDSNIWHIGARNNNNTFGIHKYSSVNGGWMAGRDLI